MTVRSSQSQLFSRYLEGMPLDTMYLNNISASTKRICGETCLDQSYDSLGGVSYGKRTLSPCATTISRPLVEETSYIAPRRVLSPRATTISRPLLEGTSCIAPYRALSPRATTISRPLIADRSYISPRRTLSPRATTISRPLIADRSYISPRRVLSPRATTISTALSPRSRLVITEPAAATLSFKIGDYLRIRVMEGLPRAGQVGKVTGYGPNSEYRVDMDDGTKMMMTPDLVESLTSADFSTGPAKLEPVRITIERATNLVDKDIITKSDPMCTVTINDSESPVITTKTINNNLNPEWDCTEDVSEYRTGDLLTFQVWDVDFFGSKTSLGKATLTHGEFTKRTPFTLYLKDGPRGCENSTLEIAIEPVEPKQVLASVEVEEEAPVEVVVEAQGETIAADVDVVQVTELTIGPVEPEQVLASVEIVEASVEVQVEASVEVQVEASVEVQVEAPVEMLAEAPVEVVVEENIIAAGIDAVAVGNEVTEPN